MKKIAYTIDLVDDPELADEYCRLHADVWPEVRDGLRAVGVHELHIFRHVRRLFMLMEVVDDFDPDTDFPAYLDTHPRCREWETLMDRFQPRSPRRARARSGARWRGSASSREPARPQSPMSPSKTSTRSKFAPYRASRSWCTGWGP